MAGGGIHQNHRKLSMGQGRFMESYENCENYQIYKNCDFYDILQDNNKIDKNLFKGSQRRSVVSYENWENHQIYKNCGFCDNSQDH